MITTTRCLILFLLIFISFAAAGQSIPSVTTDHLGKVRALYTGTAKGYVASYILDTIITTTQQKISGTLLKEGKAIATTAAVDEKSVTINHLLGFLTTRNISVQLTGTGTAKDKFVDIFSEGKYQRTITGGFNFNFFLPFTKGKYFASDKVLLWKTLQRQDLCFNRSKRASDFNSELLRLSSLHKACREIACKEKNSGRPISSIPGLIPELCQSCPIDSLQTFKVLLGKLKPYFSKGFKQVDCENSDKFLNQIAQNTTQIANDLADRENLNMLDSFQKAAPWNSFIFQWVSASIKMNQTNKPLFDSTAIDKLFTRDFRDGYLSFSLGYNRMWRSDRKNNTHFLSPVFTIDNGLVFDDDSLIKAQAQQDLTVGTTTIKTLKETSFYRQVPESKTNFGLELPYVLYYRKSGYGLDIAAGVKVSDRLDNFYGRIGLYIPISSDAENTVVIEPIVRFNKLNKSKLVFFKEMVSIGFVLGISIPKYLK